MLLKAQHHTSISTLPLFFPPLSADFDADVLVSSGKRSGGDGRTYYTYELNNPYSKSNHILASCTTKGDVAFIFKLSANDKQWQKSEGVLRKVLDTFAA